MNERKYFIDNLRWLTLMLLIPYHTAMAWNTWGEPNYIYFEGSRAISSIIVFLSTFFMPLLFVIAGVSTRYALRKRTYRQYLSERVKRLLVPLIFGTVVLMPVMTYIADIYNCGYEGGFVEHYAVFFTKFTDLTGADGGFSFGQFWFLLYLFVISVSCVSVLRLIGKSSPKQRGKLPFPLFIALGVPLPLLSYVLSVGGKSIAEYTYLFLLGYFVFSDDEVIQKTEKHAWLFFGIGTVAAVTDVYLFLWSDKEFAVMNTAAKFIAEWFMITGLIGLAKRYLNLTGKVTAHFGRISFLYYIWHFIWVVLFQFILCRICGCDTPALFVGTVVLSLAVTLLCCEICVRIPVLCFLTGTRYSPGTRKLSGQSGTDVCSNDTNGRYPDKR